jgi:hypothetical protein
MILWCQLPDIVRREILREFCNSIVSDFITYDSKFETETPYSMVWHNPHPTPFANYINALLTCREFHNAITKEIKIEANRSTSLTLQAWQHDKVLDCSYELFTNPSDDYREITLIQARIGRFWKNPYVCDEYTIFDDLFGGLEETGQLVLVCLLEGMLEKCRTPNGSRRHYVRIQIEDTDGSFHGLVFKQGSYYIGGDCIYLNTVSSFEFAAFNDSELEDFEDDPDEDRGIELLPDSRQLGGRLPDISASEPDTWWLGRCECGEDDLKEWYLVNYKDKIIIVGPRAQRVQWPDHFNWETIHLWTPWFLEEEY